MNCSALCSSWSPYFPSTVLFRDRTSQAGNVLPVALIMFGVLFDGSIVLGRLGFGIVDALSSRYTMANLLVLTGIVTFAWGHIRSSRRQRDRTRRLTAARRISFAMLAAFLVVQLGAATRFGIDKGRTTRQSRIMDARIVVNLDRIPTIDSQRFVAAYVYPNLAALRPFLQEAEMDHLSVFAPEPYRFYRSVGPPASDLIP